MTSRRLCNSRLNYIHPGPGSLDSFATASNFEFDESDVYDFHDESIQFEKKKSKGLRKIDKSDWPNNVTSTSLPVNVPDWSKILKSDCSRNHRNRGSCDVEDDNGDEDDRVPPHEYLAKVRGASLSVHEGIGRTLKGRDLRRMRNAIWKEIGFED